MKITEKQLKGIIKNEINSVIQEQKYNTLYSLVKECINETLAQEEDDDEWDENETKQLEAIDFYDFENICHSNGWDWYDSFDVNNGRQHGVRYVFDQGKGCTFDELVSKIKQEANDPNGIIAGTATHRYAPEIKHYSIIVLFV